MEHFIPKDFSVVASSRDGKTLQAVKVFASQSEAQAYFNDCVQRDKTRSYSIINKTGKCIDGAKVAASFLSGF